MNIFVYTITRKTKSETDFYELIPIGDVHLGSAGCDYARLQRTIDYIKETPNCWWCGMGDYIEAINLNDKRFDPRSIDPSYNIKSLSHLVTTQINDIKAYFRPIKDKCIGMLTGNHEDTIRLKYYRDCTLEMAEEFGVNYLGYDGFICLKFILKNSTQIATYKIYLHHGWGGSRKSGAKINRIESFMHDINADLVLLAHEHKKIIAPPHVRLDVNNKYTDVDDQKTYGAMTGCYKKAYVIGGMTYEERNGYGPADLGSIKIKFYPGSRHRKDLRIEL